MLSATFALLLSINPALAGSGKIKVNVAGNPGEIVLDGFLTGKTAPALLDDVATHATPKVREIVDARDTGSELPDAANVVELYCKHLLNSMAILSAETFAPVGMGCFPHRGALLNHADAPNCWTLFTPDSPSPYVLSPVGLGGT